MIPSNWKAFLSCDENKDSLFKLLACAIRELQPSPQKIVIATQGDNAISTPILDMSGLACFQEEADTRLLFHAFHAYNQGHRKLMVCATDTNVVVIVIAVASVLDNCEIWVAFGYGSKVRYIPCHQIAINIGSDASWGLLFCMQYRAVTQFLRFMVSGRKQHGMHGVACPTLNRYLQNYLGLLVILRLRILKN